MLVIALFSSAIALLLLGSAFWAPTLVAFFLVVIGSVSAWRALITPPALSAQRGHVYRRRAPLFIHQYVPAWQRCLLALRHCYSRSAQRRALHQAARQRWKRTLTRLPA